ncbi:MAG: M23 family metallopeptidase [Candidatus Omnitrophota bacterium]|jgi:murein DD-endopeptidase MepM/ murein hydrolase activator NlpD
MRSFFVIFILLLLTVATTVLLYQPVSVLYFKTTESYFRSPIDSPVNKLVVRNDSFGDGDYGAKRRNGRVHAGVDIFAPIGAPVYAARSGLAFFGNVPTGYGKYVMIYHPDGCQSIYGHLLNWNGKGVKNVHRGELIGFVGKTGNAQNKLIQPHLHFEIRKDGEPQEPLKLMK